MSERGEPKPQHAWCNRTKELRYDSDLGRRPPCPGCPDCDEDKLAEHIDWVLCRGQWAGRDRIGKRNKPSDSGT